MTQIPIWQTVKNIIKTACGNFLSFISLPTIILLNLYSVISYLTDYDSISPILIFIISLLLIIIAYTAGPIIISLMQKYLYEKSDNQLSYNKLIPNLDQRQFKYVLFLIYMHFRVYVFPLLIPCVLCFVLVRTLDNPAIIYGVPGILAIIILIRSFTISIGASMVHSYISVYHTNLTFAKLMQVSANTLIGNKASLFFISLITILFQSIILKIFHLFFDDQFSVINNFMSIYTSLLVHTSINTHIYLFFKDQFEANIAKLNENQQIVSW